MRRGYQINTREGSRCRWWYALPERLRGDAAVLHSKRERSHMGALLDGRVRRVDAVNRTVVVPQMCTKHQALFLHQVGIGPEGPWRSAIVAAQIALFQGTTAHPDTYGLIGGDVTRIVDLGCLACFRPDVFGQVVDAYQRDGIAGTKALGERLVNAASRDGLRGRDPQQGKP